MRRVVIVLGLAALLLAGGWMARLLPGQGVPLLTADRPSDFQSCWLVSVVVDVVADPTYGTVIKGSGSPLTWPFGYTARRTLGFEVEVLDPSGQVVLTTGSRYRLWPLVGSGGITACADPCADCALGNGVGTGHPPPTRIGVLPNQRVRQSIRGGAVE